MEITWLHGKVGRNGRMGSGGVVELTAVLWQAYHQDEFDRVEYLHPMRVADAHQELFNSGHGLQGVAHSKQGGMSLPLDRVSVGRLDLSA